MGLLFLISCVASGKGLTPPAIVPDVKPEEKFVFYSNRYAVCYLSESSTSEKLAERYLGKPGKAWAIEEINGSKTFGAGEVVVIPLQEENPGGITEEGYQTIPVLCYNRFALECKKPRCVEIDEFEQQAGYLAENGYHVITLRELEGFLYYRSSLPEKTVVLTVDGGHESAYEIAYPILKSMGLTATFLVCPEFVGTGPDFLTWEQLKEMKDNGFEIGVHSLFRCDLSQAQKGENEDVFRERILGEFKDAKSALDERLGQDTVSLAYPYGENSPAIMDVCRSAGYRLAVTIQPGANPFFADPLALKREHIQGKDPRPFEEKLKVFEESLLATGKE